MHKRRRIQFVLVTLFFFFVFLFYIISSYQESYPKLKPGMKLVQAKHAPLFYQGRWDLTNPDHPSASWPGFGCEISFTGSSCELLLTDRGNYYNVWIDENLHKVLQAPNGKRKIVTLAEGLSKGKHELRFECRNFPLGRVTQLHGIIIESNGTISRPSSKKSKQIEFIGDSYTVGEGNEAHVDSSKVTWKDERAKPAVIVVCLGLNDYSGLKQSNASVRDDDAARFRRSYVSFIISLRLRSPQAKIVILAPHNEWVRSQTKECETTLKQQGLDNLFYCQFDYFENGYVAGGHPTVETHAKIATQIIRQFDDLGISDSLR
jgi:hypothetical protein